MPVTLPTQEAGIEIPGQAELVVPVVVLVRATDYRGEFDLRLALTDGTGKIRVIQKAHFIGPGEPPR